LRCSLGIVVIATDHELLAQLHSQVLAGGAGEGSNVVNKLQVEHQTATATAIDEWLTVAEVAAWLKVSRSWVYEHTRNRGAARRERLPNVKLGKYHAQSGR
jgi:predicted DNA-binding transcriptional regulator AlpA